MSDKNGFETNKPKRNGSGRGRRNNRGRGDCEPVRDKNKSLNYGKRNRR